MKGKRGLGKIIGTGIIAGMLFLNVNQSLGQYHKNPSKNDKRNDIINAEGRAIISPENEFDHKPYAKVIFVNPKTKKDITFYANHMGIVNYSLPIQEDKDSTRYDVYITPGKNKEENFTSYNTGFVVKKENNGLTILSKEEKNSLERKVAGSK